MIDRFPAFTSFIFESQVNISSVLSAAGFSSILSKWTSLNLKLSKSASSRPSLSMFRQIYHLNKKNCFAILESGIFIFLAEVIIGIYHFFHFLKLSLLFFLSLESMLYEIKLRHFISLGQTAVLHY